MIPPKVTDPAYNLQHVFVEPSSSPEEVWKIDLPTQSGRHSYGTDSCFAHSSYVHHRYPWSQQGQQPRQKDSWHRAQDPTGIFFLSFEKQNARIERAAKWAKNIVQKHVKKCIKSISLSFVWTPVGTGNKVKIENGVVKGDENLWKAFVGIVSNDVTIHGLRDFFVL